MSINWSKLRGNMGAPDSSQPFVEEVHCRLWLGYRDRDGYGIFAIPKLEGGWTKGRAHRLVFVDVIGADYYSFIPDVLHYCDNPPCVEFRHLHPGTSLLNMREAVIRGRIPRGSQIARSVYTETVVLEMRRLHQQGITYLLLATMYGGTKQSVHLAVTGKNWSHTLD